MNKGFLTLLTALFLTAMACVLPGNIPNSLPTLTQTTLPTPPSATQTPVRKAPNALVIVKVTAYQFLRVRQRPSDAALMMAVDSYLRKGDTVTLTGVCKSGWAQILWKDSTAWVSARYLSDNKCKE